jgi:hypothetical protein
MWLWLRRRTLKDDVLQTRGTNHGDRCTLWDQIRSKKRPPILFCTAHMLGWSSTCWRNGLGLPSWMSTGFSLPLWRISGVQGWTFVPRMRWLWQSIICGIFSRRAAQRCSKIQQCPSVNCWSWSRTIYFSRELICKRKEETIKAHA